MSAKTPKIVGPQTLQTSPAYGFSLKNLLEFKKNYFGYLLEIG